jgi:broad specificity phosphatase PhoE
MQPQQTSATGVYLARHGQTAYNAERRFQGQLPVPLDDTGRSQAQQLAELVSGYGFRALWSSPLLRALQTAQVIAQRIGLEPKLDPRLAETDAGAWTDRTFKDVQEQEPERFAAFLTGDPNFAFPQGESFAAQGTRVAQALADVEAGELPALVVCHGVVIRVALYGRGDEHRALGERVENAALVALDPPRV